MTRDGDASAWGPAGMQGRALTCTFIAGGTI